VRRWSIRHPNATSEHIGQALKDQDPSVRAAAVSHSNATSEHISQALKDQDSYVQNAATEAMEKLKPKIAKSLGATAGLHNTVEGFMGGLKALPKGHPARGKFIQQHMNHAPFLSALKAHPQGAQVHGMLTAHMNSAANAGFKAGATVAVAKNEDEGLVETAFRHNRSGQIVRSGPLHDSTKISDDLDDWEQGFLDDSGRFLDREAAHQLVAGLEGELLSEDVFKADPDFFQKEKERQDQIKARIQHLATTTSGSVWKHSKGSVVVGIDPHDRAQWRATSIDLDGQPVGHQVAPNHYEALKRAKEYGADILGEPHRVHQLSKVELPVGAVKNQKMLIREPSGKKVWHSMRSGVIMSLDGHPISARQPGHVHQDSEE